MPGGPAECDVLEKRRTLEFGPEFAERVTDAHEEGRTGNTPAQRRMDYANNDVGRGLALEGFPEDAILEFVRTAPSVVRRPR